MTIQIDDPVVLDSNYDFTKTDRRKIDDQIRLLQQELAAFNTEPQSVALTTLNVDWSLGKVFTKTLAVGANAFTFSNVKDGLVIIIRLTSNAGGSTVTWPTAKWPGGSVPTQSSTGTDVYTFFKDGTDVYGVVSPAMA